MTGNPSEKIPSGESASERVEKLKDELRDIEKSAEEKLKIHDRMFGFASKIKMKYPDCKNYLVYHTLIGSSIEEEEKKDMKDGDFEGEYSIEAYYRSLIEDLKAGRIQ